MTSPKIALVGFSSLLTRRLALRSADSSSGPHPLFTGLLLFIKSGKRPKINTRKRCHSSNLSISRRLSSPLRATGASRPVPSRD
ncbi:MAG: hypothetical protein D6679_10230 [Candidatus Hydrogenedentota bacterium]|nr:MAG: hypothetical protein D6679_10230 [Candidatus Hydrogenedentota bacterium]